MTYEPKNFDHRKGGTRKSFRDSQLEQHFTRYKGYVAKLNEIEEKRATSSNAKPNCSFNEYSELKPRESVAFNGTFLHELHFENLGAAGQCSPSWGSPWKPRAGKRNASRISRPPHSAARAGGVLNAVKALSGDSHE